MTARYCLECGAPLSGRATSGLCPACALRGALADGEQTPGAVNEGLTESTASPTASGVGQRFGDYELLDEIARGGMGVVYRARQLSLDRVVAVKVIRSERLTRAEDVRRFRVEAAAAAHLQHPNIVAVHEAGEVAGQHFYSMDYVDGPSLAERVRARLFTPRDAAALVKTLAEAIQHAHERGILHRDLKPSNVLIGSDGRPRVADFGLAKVLRDEPGMTRTGEVMGSPSYMAPEQAGGRNREVDARTDVYALGTILYEVLVGRPPFRAATSIETLKLMLETVVVSPRVLDPRLPRDLETICLKCLEKNPGRRYATAKDLADDLGRFLEHQPIVARPVSPPEKLWRWCRHKPLAAVVGGSLLVAGWLAWQTLEFSQRLAQERMETAISAAIGAAWAGDQAAAELRIREAVRNGAPVEWVLMLNGQIALHSLRIDQALEDLQQAVDLAPDSLAPKAMLAAAHLYAGRADQYAATLASVLEQIGDQPPETALDCLCVGTALVAGHPDTSKAVGLLERAWQKLPSGATLLQLALAEAFHAANTGSWEVANRALAHCELAGELLGVAHPIVRTARLNALNFAIRLCPETERAELLRAGADAAAALDETQDPIGHMQRAFFFQLSTNDQAALKEWQLAIQHGGAGLFGCLYAAAMFGANRSTEALEFMNQLDRSPDSLESAACACLLLDLNRPEEADDVYQQLLDSPGHTGVLVTTLPLLAGDVDQVRLHSRRVLDALPDHHPMYRALSFLSGQDSAEAFIDAAARSRNARCTAHYFIALSYLAQGERRAAAGHLKRCLETGAHYLPTFQWGRAFLARIQNDPSWPPWIPPSKPQ